MIRREGIFILRLFMMGQWAAVVISNLEAINNLEVYWVMEEALLWDQWVDIPRLHLLWPLWVAHLVLVIQQQQRLHKAMQEH